MKLFVNFDNNLPLKKNVLPKVMKRKNEFRFSMKSKKVFRKIGVL